MDSHLAVCVGLGVETNVSRLRPTTGWSSRYAVVGDLPPSTACRANAKTVVIECVVSYTL